MTWVCETRKGSAPGQHFYKQRNRKKFKAVKCIKIKPHYLIQSIHLAQENKNHARKIEACARLNVFIKKSEMIINYF